MATISTMEATPHAIPAMVRKLRNLLRKSAETTCANSSRRKSSIAAPYCRITCCPSLRPLTISVREPLPMPVATVTRRRPVSVPASGTST